MWYKERTLVAVEHQAGTCSLVAVHLLLAYCGAVIVSYRAAGIVFVGGFSYADVLESAKGWAGTIRFSSSLQQQFQTFYSRPDTFSLGICNGCQLMALLGWVPGTGQHQDGVLPDAVQPRFIPNSSGRCKAETMEGEEWTSLSPAPTCKYFSWLLYLFGSCAPCQMHVHCSRGCTLTGDCSWGRDTSRFSDKPPCRFECRWATVAIEEGSPAVMLEGMGGSRIGVWCAHGEGRVKFPDAAVQQDVLSHGLAPIR